MTREPRRYDTVVAELRNSWKKTIKGRKGSSALSKAADADAWLLEESLYSASPLTVAAWTCFANTWANAEAARITEEPSIDRRNPASSRSILASLNDRQRRTWSAYRRILTRGSRSVGKRNREVSRELLAIGDWAKREHLFSAILEAIVLKKRASAQLEKEIIAASALLFDRLRLALDNVQDAIDYAKAPKPLKGSRFDANIIGDSQGRLSLTESRMCTTVFWRA